LEATVESLKKQTSGAKNFEAQIAELQAKLAKSEEEKTILKFKVEALSK